MILHFKRLALRLLCPWLIKDKFIVAMLSGKSFFVSSEKPGSSPINTKNESLKNSNARGSISSSEEWLLVPKLLYFSLNLVIYSTNAFLFQYVETYWRIPKAEFALINVFQFTSFVGALLFSRIADLTGKHRSILAGCVVGYCLFRCLIIFPEFFGETERHLKLLYFYAINGACFFFTGGAFPILDSLVMNKLSSNSNFDKDMFGRQCLWGSIGRCIIGVVVYKLYEITGQDFNVMFYTLIVSSVLFIITVFWGIPKDLRIKVETHDHIHTLESQADDKISKELSAGDPSQRIVSRPGTFYLLTKPKFFFFLGTVFVAGFIRAMTNTLRSVFITNELFLEKSVISNSIFFSVFPEIFLYFYSKKINQKIGIYWIFIIGHIAGIIRTFGCTFLRSSSKKNSYPNLPVYFCIIAIESFNGINSSFVITSATRIASDMAPKGMAFSAQGLVVGTLQGFSMTIASLAGYLMVEAFDIRSTFILSSLLGAVCVVLILIKFAFFDRVIFINYRKSIS